MSVPHVVKEALEVIIDISRSAFPSTGDPKIDVPVEQIVEVLNVATGIYFRAHFETFRLLDWRRDRGGGVNHSSGALAMHWKVPPSEGHVFFSTQSRPRTWITCAGQKSSNDMYASRANGC